MAPLQVARPMERLSKSINKRIKLCCKLIPRLSVAADARAWEDEIEKPDKQDFHVSKDFPNCCDYVGEI